VPLVGSAGLALAGLLRLLLLKLIETLKLLLLRLELLLLLWLELLLPLLELLLLRLKLLLLRLELLRLLDTLPSWVKVRSLSVRLELWCLLLELLLLLDLVEAVEVAGLAPGLLLEPVPLLLLLSCSLCTADLLLSLSLSLLCNSLLLSGLALPDKISLDHFCQSLDVQAEEHIEGVFLSLLRKGGELLLAVLLQVWPQGEVLLVEGSLLLPAESLPRCRVCEWLKTKLLVLKLLGDSKSLAGSEDQLVCLCQVNVSKMSNKCFSLLAR